MFLYVLLIVGVFMGWSLGSNDAANAFGTAVSTGVVKYKTAVILISVFIVVGAAISGSSNLENLCKIAISNKVMSSQTDIILAMQSNCINSLMLKNVIRASVILFCAGMTVFVMTYMKLPVSANQSTIGAIVGWGIHFVDFSNSEVLSENLMLFGRFALGWLLNPLCAAVLGFFIIKLTMPVIDKITTNKGNIDKIIKSGYIVSGLLASYSMGANSSSNVTSLYYDCFADGYKTNLFENPQIAVAVGGIAMALGVLTYSKKVMTTVGNDIVKLNQSEGFLVIIAMSLTILLIENIIKIPVSNSQAIVGALVGAGLTKGIKRVNFTVVKNIAKAWITSPVIAGTMSYVLGVLLCGFFH